MLISGDFELEIAAGAFDVVESALDGEALPVDFGQGPSLFHGGDGSEAEGGEEFGKLLKSLVAAFERKLEFAARFGVGVDFGAFVGDEVLLADLAEAEGFVGLGEIAGGVAEVEVNLVDGGLKLSAEGG